MFIELLVGVLVGGQGADRPMVECVPRGQWPARVASLPVRERVKEWAFVDGTVVYRWWVCDAVEWQNAGVVVGDRLLGSALFATAAGAGASVPVADPDCFAEVKLPVLGEMVGKPKRWGVRVLNRWGRSWSTCWIRRSSR